MSEIRGLHEFRARLAQAKLLILQGVGALKEQRFDHALASFQQSIEKGAELPTGNYYLGLTWERKDDAEQALASTRTETGLRPGPLGPGATVLAPERSRALEEFHQAVMCDPDLAEAHYNLGRRWHNQEL